MKNISSGVEVKLKDGRIAYVPFSGRQMLLELIEIEKEGTYAENLRALDESGKECEISPCDIVEVR